MGLKSFILGNSYDIRCIRRKIRNNGNKNSIDFARTYTDEDMGSKMLEFKSDGAKTTVPEDANFDQLWYRKWYHKLMFMPEQRTDFFEYVERDKDDDDLLDGDFVSFNYENGDAEEAGMDRMFNTHRDFMTKKILEVFEEDDNHNLVIAGYLTALAFITLGAMYVIVTGVKDSIASSVEAGISTGLETAQNTGDLANNANQNMIPIMGLMGYQMVYSMKKKLAGLVQGVKNQ